MGQVQFWSGQGTTPLSANFNNSRMLCSKSGLQYGEKLDLARERYAVLTAASHFELTNALTAVARARENLVNALFQLNTSRVNWARATGSLNSLH